MLFEDYRRKIIEKNPALAGLDDVVEKELLHHDILAAMQGHGLLDDLCFVGGTALRLCHNSSRLSEDLDFAADPAFKKEDLSDMAQILGKAIEGKYETQVYVRESQAKGDTSIWKITITKDAADPSLPSQKLHIDISAYPALNAIKRPIVDHYGASPETSGTFIRCLSIQESLADKMIALAFRERRVKPRDLWDIAWLVQQDAKIDVQMILEKLAMCAKRREVFSKTLRKQVLRLAEDETRDDFNAEMRRFVASTTAARTLDNPSFWPYLIEVVERQVDTFESLILAGDLADQGVSQPPRM